MKHPVSSLFSALLVLAAFSLATPASAQKVLERSQKKRPEWVGNVLEGYLIVSATDRNMETAKQKALASVKTQMLESVAQNVEFSIETLIEQFTHNQNVESNVTFRQQGKTSVVNLPFLTGITLAKAKDSYWEREQSKSGSEVVYIFSVIYPFSSAEQATLRAEFEKLEANMAAQLTRLSNAVNDISHSDSIESAIRQLNIVKDYYFDNRRKQETANVIAQYEKAYERLIIESDMTDRGVFECWLTLDGNPIGGITKPRAKAECATDIKFAIDNGRLRVTYSDTDCIKDDDNTIELTFTIAHKRIKHTLHL